MTYEEFLKRLGLMTGWRIVTLCGGPWIRRARVDECPVAAVAGMQYVSDAHLQGFRIDDHELTDIMRAADGREGHDPAIRHDLLVACGLASTEVVA